MTQENRELLFIDLCSRLPYGIRVLVVDEAGYEHILPVDGYLSGTFRINGSEYDIDEVKPYLRPLSSMTREERLELSRLTNDKFKFYLYTTKPEIVCYEKYNYLEGLKVLDWLLSRHFDIRGLIPMGLAFEAPENMYKIE